MKTHGQPSDINVSDMRHAPNRVRSKIRITIKIKIRIRIEEHA